MTLAPFSILIRKQVVQQTVVYNLYNQLVVSVPLPCQTQRIDLSRQEAGRKVFHFPHWAPDMSFQQLTGPPSIVFAVHMGLNIIIIPTVKVVWKEPAEPSWMRLNSGQMILTSLPSTG